MQVAEAVRDERGLFAQQGYAVRAALIEPAPEDFFWSYVHTKFASLLLSSGDPQVKYMPAAATRPGPIQRPASRLAGAALGGIGPDGDGGVTRTIWLASYPKSGNTWFRMLVANLSSTDGKPVDINDLPERGGMASARAPFDYLTLIDSGLLTHDEIDVLRPRVYETLALGVEDDEYESPPVHAPVRFVKVHDAYTLTPKGEPLLAGARGADGAIVVVRDPRDLASSYANHYGMTIDEAIACMNDKNTAMGVSPGRQHLQLLHRIRSWSAHVASWLDQTDILVHIVRYEDLREDTFGTFRRALEFAGRPAADADIRRAVSFASFTELQKQERDKGFREAPLRHRGERFFRRGKVGAWRDELTADQVARIEAKHTPMMRRLGYDLSSGGAQVPGGMGKVV